MTRKKLIEVKKIDQGPTVDVQAGSHATVRSGTNIPEASKNNK